LSVPLKNDRIFVKRNKMKIVLQFEKMSDLDEISQWLENKHVTVQQVIPDKMSASTLIKRLSRIKIVLPEDFKFDRN
jgi:hypothetical protein